MHPTIGAADYAVFLRRQIMTLSTMTKRTPESARITVTLSISSPSFLKVLLQPDYSTKSRNFQIACARTVATTTLTTTCEIVVISTSALFPNQHTQIAGDGQGRGAQQLNQTVYVTEVFYNFQAITPIGNFLSKTFLPSQLYDVAYF